jgi:hypothetical protein
MNRKEEHEKERGKRKETGKRRAEIETEREAEKINRRRNAQQDCHD